jgi:hypothetical protein
MKVAPNRPPGESANDLASLLDDLLANVLVDAIVRQPGVFPGTSRTGL